MADIYHDFPIEAPAHKVFWAISTPAGLDRWWTERSNGHPSEGAEYELWFGPQYDWQARVTKCLSPKAFELEITKAGADWLGTRVGFCLEQGDGVTSVRFYHTGWPLLNEHFRISCYCWAMYLRVLRRHLEYGEFVPYENRLEV
jgi:uncharacterized protein YndB with AHSA1/START domain